MADNTPVIVLRGGDVQRRLGSAEIAVATSATSFAAPDLILHYVRTHGYRPPAEFIQAVLDGPDERVLRGWAILGSSCER